MVTENRIAERK